MNILDCIGNTPLIFLDRISRILGVNIYAKLENMNPGFSHKDRVALAYLKGAMQCGELSKGGCVVEASNGNLGLALARACVKLDLRLLLCMPASVDRQRLALLHAMGAHVFVTPAEEGMKGALEKAAYHHYDTWGSFRPNPRVNPDGPACYYTGLGAELVETAEARELPMDAFVCGVGSGATFTGIARRLREVNPHIFLGAVKSPACAPLEEQTLNDKENKVPQDGHPSPVLDNTLVSQWFTIASGDAEQACNKLLGMEGVKAGLSSGANLHAALLLAQQPSFKGKNIIMLVHDAGS